jgi:hypothetical protein
MTLWQGFRAVTLTFTLLLTVTAPVLAAGVKAGFDLASPSAGPFPSNIFTVADPSHNTGLRVSLPKPNCAARPTDCADIDVINVLDGFNLQPRITVSFSGAINVASVNSGNVFFLSLGDTLGGAGGQVIGINQVVWDPVSKTLHAESDELLDQHTRYALIVTNGIRDTAGDPVEAGAFATFRRDLNFGQTKNATLKAYRKSLLDAIDASGLDPATIVTASVFSTQSATAVLEKIRDRIKAMPVTPATILASFPRANVAAIQWNRQTRSNGSTTSSFVALPALDVFPGAVGRIVFGRFSSPDWETPGKVIPAVGTLTGVPAVQSVNTLYFNLFVPAGTPPAGGWPVAIFGHGFTDSKQGAPTAVASTLAHHGIATIAINVVGHGGGGTTGNLTIVPLTGAPVTIPDGGRGIDQDGNGVIDSTEGSSAAPPNGLVGSRDGLRQTVADLMQLVRVLQAGVDVDGDGVPDLNGRRIYYAGQSFGGIYGVKFIAVEPDIRAGVPNVPGGAIIEIARLSPAFRALVGIALASRVPSLCNAGTLAPPLWCFQESIPLRDDPAVTAPAPGRDADPGGDRQHGVGLAGRQPGRVRTAPAKDPARRRAHAAVHHPERQGRPDGAEPDLERHRARRRHTRPMDALPQRPRARRATRRPDQPAHLPHEHRRGQPRGGRAVDRGPEPDRNLLRERRRRRRRPRRHGPLLRGPDRGRPDPPDGRPELLGSTD